MLDTYIDCCLLLMLFVLVMYMLTNIYIYIFSIQSCQGQMRLILSTIAHIQRQIIIVCDSIRGYSGAYSRLLPNPYKTHTHIEYYGTN